MSEQSNQPQWWQGAVTPAIALQIRNTLADLIGANQQAVCDLAVNSWSDSRRARELCRLAFYIVRAADVTIWRGDLWAAALSGNEMFEGLPVPKTVVPAGPAFWIWADGGRISDHADFYELDCECSLQGWIPIPTGRGGVVFAAAYMPLPAAWPEHGYLPRLRFLPTIELGEPCSRVAAHLAAASEFLSQPIIVTRDETLPRGLRRRLERAKAVLPGIRTVVLRREIEDPEAPRKLCGSAVHWQHQWTVRGHWRNQFFPSTGEHRPVYISSHIKGPPDKPLRDAGVTIFRVQR